MRVSIAAAMMIGFLVPHARGDRYWAPEAYTDVVARANAHRTGARHDPQEDDPRLTATFAAADARAIHGLSNADPDYPGFIKLFWRVKKKILLHEYGIHWKSPADLNPTKSYGPPDG
jgi:hypothetical protein